MLFSEQVKKDNIENVTIDDLVAKVTPIGRQKVPSQVKEEILLRLRNFLEDEWGKSSIHFQWVKSISGHIYW